MKQPRSRPLILTPQQLRSVIRQLSPVSPKTDHFSARWRRLDAKDGGQQKQKKVWYRTQHEHWLGWLRAYSGPGAYQRKDWSRSAEFVYNHIVNPQMLVYLAEAAKIPRAKLTQAMSEALANRSTMSSMSSAIRRVIPWPVVHAALLREKA